MDLDTQLTIPPQVMSRLVGEETVLLDLATGMYFGLDGVGKLVWESVSDGLTLAEAAVAWPPPPKISAMEPASSPGTRERRINWMCGGRMKRAMPTGS